jgi:spore maturation protein CgeB
MKVLFAGALYDEGRNANGRSYEYNHLWLPLRRTVSDAVVFDFMEELAARGRESMNAALVETVARERPDVVIVAPFTDQLDAEIFDQIRRTTPCLGYFFDDAWRVAYTSRWARHLTFITTSDVRGVQRYRDLGVSNVLYSPFGCNTELFRHQDVPPAFDVSFVGGYHPYRAWIMRLLRRAGIDVHVRGTGWPGGRVTEPEMVDIFNRSRVNLNLSNAVSWDLQYLSAIRRPVRETVGVWRTAIRARRLTDAKTREMVKGRHFEINGCGGFQLSFYVEGLERHYRIGDEIAIYVSADDLVDKVRYYLRHPDERQRVAEAGHRRTIGDHTMEARFLNIFDQMGLRVSPRAPADSVRDSS